MQMVMWKFSNCNFCEMEGYHGLKREKRTLEINKLGRFDLLRQNYSQKIVYSKNIKFINNIKVGSKFLRRLAQVRKFL